MGVKLDDQEQFATFYLFYGMPHAHDISDLSEFQIASRYLETQSQDWH